jgi:hypothetical protein
MDDGPDLGEAADYILAERPKLDEQDVWSVLNELGNPPPGGTDGVALNLLAGTQPQVKRRHAKQILREWRAYAGLADAEDWELEQ